MKFNTSKASNMYMQMFGEYLDDDTIRIAQEMSEEEFNDSQNQFDEDGEYRDVPLSAGQWDCIEASLY